MKDQELFDIVAREIQSQGVNPGLWARAIAESGQDDGRAKAAYIKLRVQALKDEASVKNAKSTLNNKSSIKQGNNGFAGMFQELITFLPRLVLGPQILAISGLTWKAALRFRLFLVIAALLVLAVVGLPLVIKDDGTAQGFTQIILTYTLTSITALLGLSSLWLACGTLARDIEECQIQVVATKPVARWQIWLGKWLGLVTLNAVLLALAGGCVYGMMQWRASQLPPAEQTILREQVLVARGSARPAKPDAEIASETERILANRLKTTPVDEAELPELRRIIRAGVMADAQVVPPSYTKQWQIDLGFAKNRLHGQPLQLRVKFNASQKNAAGTYQALWQVGVPKETRLWQSGPMSLSADNTHEFTIPPDLFDANGLLTIAAYNADDAAALSFPLDDGIEVLYPEGGFALNFARGLAVIFCWMALLAALGLLAASFLSFPVATFFALGLLLVGLSSGTLVETVQSGSVGAGNAETGQAGHSMADIVLIPAFKAILAVTNFIHTSSPIDSLSTGRSISWTELALVFAQVVGVIGGSLAVAGILLFNRRELAATQGTQ